MSSPRLSSGALVRFSTIVRVAACVLAVAASAARPAAAEYVLMTGETWNTMAPMGLLLLPSGTAFSFPSQELALVTTDVEPSETLIFDLVGDTVRIDTDAPSLLLATDPFFLSFAPESEIQAWSEGAISFESGPSAATVDAPGVVVWVGEIAVPPPGGGSAPTDSDGDGVPDSSDNCVSIPNADQADADGDGQGDVCDPDDDNDGVLDTVDNCVFVANASQLDTDADGAGDACDPDDDGDGLTDVLEIGTYGTNPLLKDSDLDGWDDDVEIAAGTDPNDPLSNPGAAVPALGVIGWVLLSTLLMAAGVFGRRRDATGTSSRG